MDKLERSTVARGSDTLTVSTIGGDLTITGNVTSKGEIQLDGHVHGDVHCVALVLGENSNVEGNVTADDVVIRGRLRPSRFCLQGSQAACLWDRCGKEHDDQT